MMTGPSILSYQSDVFGHDPRTGLTAEPTIPTTEGAAP
jgi:hypothetical protein